MSTEEKRSRTQILPIAQRVLEGLSDSCTRIEFAGSLRRGKEMIGDVELVVIPDGDKLYSLLDQRLLAGKISHTPVKRWGSKYRAFIFNGVKFDVFINPDPATFAVNFLIRTGCAEFSHRMVTMRSAGGWLPECYLVKNARVRDRATGEALDTPEEKDVFRLWGMEMPAPEERTENFVPMWAEVEFEHAEKKAVSYHQTLGQSSIVGGKLTMERAEQIVEESRTWALPLFGKETATRMASEAIAKSRG